MPQGKDLGALVTRFTTDMRQWERSMSQMQTDMQQSEREARRAADQMNKQFERVGRQMEQVGRQMTKFVTLPLTAIGGASFKMAKDFEASMSQITGLVGVASDQVDEWQRDLVEMAPELAKSPQELADALFFVTSAGFEGAEAMDVLEQSAKAAAAGLGETKEVADLVTSAVNAYGIENLSAGEATDILTASVREGKAEADELAQSMGQVLPVASELGVTFDQVGAATAAMTRTGTDASTAAQQLRQIMASLMGPTEGQEEAFRRMGISSEELLNMLAGDKGLIGVLQFLRQRTDETTVAMDDVIPNIRALSGALDIVGNNAEENAQIFENLKDSSGALDVAFEAASDTMEFRWQQALQSGSAALVDIGMAMREIAIPALEGFSYIVQAASDWFRNLDEGMQQFIIQIGAVAAAIGPLSIGIGVFTRTVLPIFTSQIMAARGAMIALNTAIRANPIGSLMLGVAALYPLVRTLATRTDEATESQQALNRAHEQADDRVDEQRAKINQLTHTIENNNIPLEMRKEAIEKLNDIAPEYEGHLTEEGELIDHNTEALDKYLERLRERTLLTAMEDELTQAYKNQFQAARELDEAQRELKQGKEELTEAGLEREGVAHGHPSYAVTIDRLQSEQNAVERNQKAYERYNEAVKELEERLTDFRQRVSDTSDSQQDLENSTEEGSQANAEYSEEVQEVLDDLDRQIDQSERMAEVQEELGDETDLVSDKISAHESALQSLIEQGLDPSHQAVRQLISDLHELRDTQVPEVPEAPDRPRAEAERPEDIMASDPEFEFDIDDSPAQGSIEALQNRVQALNTIIETTGSESLRNWALEQRASVNEQIENLRSLEDETVDAMDVAENMATQFTQSFGDGMANVIVQGERLSDVLGNIRRLLLSQAIQTGISLLLGGGGMLTGRGITGGILGSVFGVGDALIRDDGSVIQFHPDDNILAMKDFSALGSGIENQSVSAGPQGHVAVSDTGTGGGFVAETKVQGSELVTLIKRVERKEGRSGKR